LEIIQSNQVFGLRKTRKFPRSIISPDLKSAVQIGAENRSKIGCSLRQRQRMRGV